MNRFTKALSTLIGVKPEPVNQISPESRRALDLIYAASKKSPKEVASLLESLVKSHKDFTAKDIHAWRDAWQRAADPFMPIRKDLLEIYELTVWADGHLRGVVQQRILKVLCRTFILVDKDGKEDMETTKLLRRRWFRKFCKLALEVEYWGHSLIQFDSMFTHRLSNRLEFKSVQLVPRQHVKPEIGHIVTDVYDASGYDYRNGPLANWVVEVGEPDNLGLLNVVAKEAISKKWVSAFWDQFSEIFGMPVRIAKSSSRDPKEKAEISAMLAQMGAAAYALFPEGTEIEFVETARTDAYRVYDSRIDRCNSEMSKAILSQTMTTDDGASLSQAKVHSEVLEEVTASDLENLADVINDDLIPFLIAHGYPLEGFTFHWADDDQLSLDQQQVVDEWILDTFDVDDSYYETLAERYQAPIKGLKKSTAPAPEAPVPGKSDRGSRALGMTAAIASLYRPTCHVHGTPVAEGDFTPDWLDNEFERIAQGIFSGAISPGEIDLQITRNLAQDLLAATITGYGSDFDQLDDNTPDKAMLISLRRNVWIFSGAKTYQQIRELSDLLIDAQGKVREFADFAREARTLYNTYNLSWLRSEYNHAIAASRMAAAWVDFQKNADINPALEYQTAGDERVRLSHQLIDGVVRPVDDDFWDVYYPPNGWGCRCDVVGVSSGRPVTDIKDKAMPDIPDLFRNNTAKEGVVFPSGHPYFEMNKAESKKLQKLIDKEIKAL